MNVKIWFQLTSQPTEFNNALCTYQKGDLFCIRTKVQEIYKFPLCNIFRIIESNFVTTITEEAKRN